MQPNTPNAIAFASCTLVLLISIAGCKTEKKGELQAVDSPSARAPIDRVTAGKPVKKTLRLFTEQPARVEAFEQTSIQSKISGYIESVDCDIGDQVTQGQVLIRIRAPEYEDQRQQKVAIVGQADAEIKQAEAALHASQAAANSSKALVAQAQASIARAQAEYSRWDSENQRMQQLVTRGSVTSKLAEETASQFQAAEAVRQEALASVESAKARQQQAEAGVATAEADVDAAKAKLQVAQAELKQAQTMLTYTELASPFNGHVTSRKGDAGHYVHPAGTDKGEPLLTISNLSKVRVFVNVPESEAPWVDAGFLDASKGDSATIQINASYGRTIEGRITRSSLQIDPQSRSLTAQIDIDNSDLKLLPGTFATAKILLEERADVMTLPTAAIVRNAGQTVCCVVVDGKIEHRTIALGLRVEDDVQVSSGLNGDEIVVLARAGSLQPGQAVEVLVKK